MQAHWLVLHRNGASTNAVARVAEGWELDSGDTGTAYISRGTSHAGNASLRIDRRTKSFGLHKTVCKTGGSLNFENVTLSMWIHLDGSAAERPDTTCRLGTVQHGEENYGGEFTVGAEYWAQIFGPSRAGKETVTGFHLSCTLTQTSGTSAVNVYLDDGLLSL